MRTSSSAALSRPALPAGLTEPIDAATLYRALAIRDLADPAGGAHAVQLVADRLERAVAAIWDIPVRRHAGSRLVSVADNYDRLRYHPRDVTRASRYSRYAGDGMMLRSHTTAHIPELLADIARADRTLADAGPDQVLLSVPGICYRRDVIDRRHVGEPHQHDLWVIRRRGPALGESDLEAMIAAVMAAVLPGRSWRTPASSHPYTRSGREIYASTTDGDVEIGECGLAEPLVLSGAGLGTQASGLAMGLGLDRIVMAIKGVDDIRLLRSADPRINSQMTDLAPYQPVSAMPAIRRDLSLAVTDPDAELLGDRVRVLLGERAAAIEAIEVLAQTPYDQLPAVARDRLGIRARQVNVLLRLVLRDHARTLSDADANAIRDEVYAGLHEGRAGEWTSPASAANRARG